jgi:DNA-directed RNA polymerase specialized sigma24 family protein
MSTDTQKRVYEATAYRDGKWWTFEIPELSNPAPVAGERIVAMGQARKIEELDQAAREVAALWLDVPEDAAQLWTNATDSEAAAREAVKEAARLRRQAVAVMKDHGLTQAETGQLLGISTQRVGQLINS